MKFITFIIMLIILFAYAFIGGCILRVIEINREIDFIGKTNATVSKIIDDNSCITIDDVVSFQSIVKDMNENGIFLKDPNTTAYFRERFDIRSAILVASTLYAGFGIKYAVPQTIGGQIFSNGFAMFGSYYLFFVMYMSGQLFDVFLQILFKKLRKNTTDRTVNKFIHFRQFILTVIGIIFFVLIPAAIIQSIENWPYDETLYFCITYMITLGFTDYIPGHDYDNEKSEDFIKWYRLAVGFWLIISVLWFAIIIFQFCGLFGWFIWEHIEEVVEDRLERVKYVLDNNTYRRALEKSNQTFRKKFNKSVRREKEIRKIDEIERQRRLQLKHDRDNSQPETQQKQEPDSQLNGSLSKNMILFDPGFEQGGQISHGEVSVIKF